MKQLSNEIIKVFKYFSFFDYKPTFDEIYTFLPVKIDKNKLKYTPPQYSIRKIKDQRLKIKNSEKKLNNWRFRVYLKLISIFPQIKLVGLSGSISMMNAGEDDDIDLFIITAKNRLFTGRLISLFLAQMLGLRRDRDSATHFFHKTNKSEKNAFALSHYYKNKVCLNLLFDESDLRVPKFKQTEFVGHEVLQMKPIITKGNVYDRFLKANQWVFRLFPNAKEVVSSKYQILSIKQKKLLNTYFLILNTFAIKIESFLKSFQLRLIKKHQTTEIVTDTQLWFHPDDFERKIKKTL